MFKLNVLSVVIATLALSACGSSSSDEKVTIPTPVPEKNYPITYAFKSTGEGEPEYIVSQNELLTAELNADNRGIEQQGWNFFYQVNNTLFLTGYQNKETISYTMQNDEVKELARFTFNNTLEMFGTVNNDTLIATDNSRTGGHSKHTMYVVSSESGHIVQQLKYSIFNNDTGTPGEGSVAWATALIERNGELFVPFQKMDDGGNWSTPDPDTAYVAVFDYPLTDGATPKKIIEDERTSNIGVNGFVTSMIKTEAGDLYTMSNGSAAAGFSPASTKPSGILKINADENTFDANYFFNIETATNGGKLFWFDYIGDNKALARIHVDQEGTSLWSAYSKDLHKEKLYIIDLVSEVVTEVVGVPLHQKRYTTPLEIIEGKVYLSIEEKDDANVYEIDVASGTAIKGASIKGKTVKGFFDLTR
jgi:hypothetical protein